MTQRNTPSTRTAFLSRAFALTAALVLALVLGACGGTPASTTDDSGDSAPVGTVKEQEGSIDVTVTIDGSAAEVEPLTSELSLDEGATVYDALVATGADVNAQDSQYGMYVAGINGLASGDHGDMSGWLFAVNGETPSEGASKVELKDGDVVTWTYTTGEADAQE